MLGIVGRIRRREVLGEILKASRASIALANGLSRNEGTIRDAAADVKGVVDLLQLTIGTLNRGINATRLAQCSHDFSIGVVLACAGYNVGILQELICAESFEEVDSLLKEVGNFFLRGVVSVAGWLQGRIACAVLAPLVLPEGLVLALVIFPVCVHVTQQICLAEGLEDTGDIGVLARLIAKLRIGPIAKVRP